VKWKNFCLCFFSSILLILSFPKFNFSFLVWVALVPLFFAIKNSSLRNAFIFGFLTGLFAYLGLLYWIVTTITAAGESLILGVLCLLLLSACLALYFGLFSLAFVFLSNLSPPPAKTWRAGITYHLSPAFTWVSLEYLRSHLFTGFPWALLGYSQWNFLPIIQISELTGVYGVSFLVALVNITIFQVLTIKNLKLKIKNLILTTIIFSVCLAYGLFRLSTYLPAEASAKAGQPINLSTPFKVVLLQGNIDQYKKWSKEYEEEIMNTYENLIHQTISPFHHFTNPPIHQSTISPSLIIWPESAIPGYLLYEPHLYQWVRNLIHQTACYHLIGSVHLRENKLYNSVFLFSPQGRLLAEYDKIHLVPFGEAIPLKGSLSRYIKVLNELGDFSSSNKFTVFTIHLSTYPPIHSVTFATNICFEAIFPHLVCKFVKNGAEIIVNLTNDAWFLKTSAPYQHFTMNVFRAIENRKYVVRCANTGISAFIDPYGRIIKQTPIFTALTLSEEIYGLKKKTFYTRFGDLFAQVCLLIVIVTVVASFMRRAKKT